MLFCALFIVDCCLQKLSWSFCSDGLRTFGEPEVLVLLECSEAELRLFESECEPSRTDAYALTDTLIDVLDLYNTVFNEFAQTGAYLCVYVLLLLCQRCEEAEVQILHCLMLLILLAFPVSCGFIQEIHYSLFSIISQLPKEAVYLRFRIAPFVLNESELLFCSSFCF